MFMLGQSTLAISDFDASGGLPGGIDAFFSETALGSFFIFVHTRALASAPAPSAALVRASARLILKQY
jgi:hypothetical protein